jgi:glycosyltransferase involved in cell wall biosynthesis
VSKPIAVVDSSAELGGAELSLLPVVRELAETHAVVAFLPSDGPLRERLVEMGAHVEGGFRLPQTLARESRQYGGRNLAALGFAAIPHQARLAAAFARLRPAVVYCNGFRAQLGATVPASLLRIPIVWHIRDFVPQGGSGRIWTHLSRLASVLLANSSATATQRGLSRRALIARNGIDLELFPPREQEPPPPPVLGMVGHLTPWKGHLRFLRVLAAARERVPDLRGAIAGGPIYRTSDHAEYPARVERERSELGLDGRCEVEQVEPAAMSRFLSRLTLFLHCPDRPEPFGRSLVEAMAVGVPVIAAAGEGAGETVGDAAVVCRIGDDDAIREAVVDLLADPQARSSRALAGIERAHSQFDESVYARHVADVIREAATRRQS